GYEIFTYNLFRALAARGNEVRLYLPHRELRKRGGFYQALPFPCSPMLPRTHSMLKRAPWLLRAHLNREQARHGFHVWQAMGAYPEAWTILGVRAPKVLRCYGEDVQMDDLYGYGIRLDKTLEPRVLRAVAGMDRVVAMTDSLERLLTDLGVEPGRIRRVPNGIDAARFGQQRDTAAVRRAWNVPQDRLLLLTVGRNHAKKGFCLIPAMAARLKNAGVDFTWLVVGGATSRLQPAIDCAGVTDRVIPVKSLGAANTAMPADRLALPVDELLDLYAAADVFILPSRLEGFSRVIIEAMAAGLPVVTTDAPGCGEVFTDGVQGFVRGMDDDDAMADAVRTLAEDPALRRAMGLAAREYALAFDWDAIASRYEAVYAAVNAAVNEEPGHSR
ncbi:MAG: glycosyltransferase family 4 protein, partial [Desulfovibrionaceae bacterium]